MPGCLETNLNTIPWCSKELQPNYRICFQHFQPIRKVIWSEYFRRLPNSVCFRATCHNSITCFFRRFGGPYQTTINDHPIGFNVILANPSQNSTAFQVFESIFAAETAVMWPKSGHVVSLILMTNDEYKQTKNTKIWKLWKVKALFGMATCPQKKRHFAVQHKTFIRKYKADPGCWGQDQQCYGRVQGEGRNGRMSPVLWTSLTLENSGFVTPYEMLGVHCTHWDPAFSMCWHQIMICGAEWCCMYIAGATDV